MVFELDNLSMKLKGTQEQVKYAKQLVKVDL